MGGGGGDVGESNGDSRPEFGEGDVDAVPVVFDSGHCDVFRDVETGLDGCAVGGGTFPSEIYVRPLMDDVEGC